MHNRRPLGEIWSPWEEVVALRQAWYGVPCVVAVIAAAWGAPASSRTAPPDPVSALVRLAVSPPSGVRFARGLVTEWTAFPEGGMPPMLQRLAWTVIRRAAGMARTQGTSGRQGELRWYRYQTASTSAVAVFMAPVPALHMPGTISLVLSATTGAGPGLAIAATHLQHALVPWGRTHVAASLYGEASALAPPLALAGSILALLRAKAVEQVGGTDAADAFGRMAKLPTVQVAGRAFNVEVSVGRNRRGLLVNIGTPLLPPPSAAGPGA